MNGTYDDQDRLTQYGDISYLYTATGDLESKTTASQTTIYNYDAFGNLKEVTLPNGNIVEYAVDGQDRRIGKKDNGTWVQKFLYLNPLKPVAQLDGNNNVVSQFVYGTLRVVPDYMVRAGAMYRIISDYIGSPRLVVDVATGSVIQRMDYDEFGNVTLDTNPGFQPFGFAGGLYDYETGLVGHLYGHQARRKRKRG